MSCGTHPVCSGSASPEGFKGFSSKVNLWWLYFKVSIGHKSLWFFKRSDLCTCANLPISTSSSWLAADFFRSWTSSAPASSSSWHGFFTTFFLPYHLFAIDLQRFQQTSNWYINRLSHQNVEDLSLPLVWYTVQWWDADLERDSIGSGRCSGRWSGRSSRCTRTRWRRLGYPLSIALSSFESHPWAPAVSTQEFMQNV